MAKTPYGVPKPSRSEQKLIDTINDTWTRERALSELKAHLQVAVEIELATIPIYLYTYYSINRTITGSPANAGFPQSPVARFADKAGALIMSVAVEEMLHMSLSSNISFSLGQQPRLYLLSPGPYPTNLPGHAKLGPDAKTLALPLAPFSEQQLWNFLEIEYPANADAPPEGSNWETIGQVYSYIRCIIYSQWIEDSDFLQGAKNQQIQPGNYSPNNIDTAYPTASFDKTTPVPASAPGSAAQVTDFASREDSHTGRFQLTTITSCEEALEAIATIDFQGEGFNNTKVDDPSKQELSHYYKFLTLQSELEGYEWHAKGMKNGKGEPLPLRPQPPKPPEHPFTPAQLAEFVVPYPTNPVSADLAAPYKSVVDLSSGLYQYMLILTETIFKVPSADQKVYFNRALHMSMIWILDKFLQAMRGIETTSKGTVVALAPTFENLSLGSRDRAFQSLSELADAVATACGNEPWYSDISWLIPMIKQLPDVSDYWKDDDKFAGAPVFPRQPPATIPGGASRHACMGLNDCKNQGRTLSNDCAGMGYCSTALQWNPADAGNPSVTDHQCHVRNDCRGQGGCGLYGTAEEQDSPGDNDCRSLGSCATPINAERFSTDGGNQGKSVWHRARKVFWAKHKARDPKLPAEPPNIPGSTNDPDLFKDGPTIEWIQNEGGGMTACGSSGLSGAGSCA
ncbi:MAG: ferritin-like domain-containing protein [Myxococcota bacterium]